MAWDCEPFQVRADEVDLEDLAGRLARTRWPADLPSGWQRGMDPLELRELTAYWRGRFDWRAQERFLNSFPQYKVRLDGGDIHFVHIRGRGPDPMPLLLTHGWPSSFAEFLAVVPTLTDPAAHGGSAADAFDVVVPSLPGFGFSSGPPGRQLIRDTPRLWTRLMTEVLGYPRFAAHGTDIGAFVTNRLALEHPSSLIAAHVTLLAEPRIGPGEPPLTGDEQAFARERIRTHERSQAYAHLQRTTPTTLAYALHDSPVGLAAWIVEKWRNWSDCDGDLKRRFSAEQLLTTVMIYWLTGTTASAMHAYADLALASASVPGHEELYPDAPSGADASGLPPGRRIDVPVGLLRTSAYDPPRSWADRSYSDIRRWSRAASGGHFLAMEEPALLIDELKHFFRLFR